MSIVEQQLVPIVVISLHANPLGKQHLAYIAEAAKLGSVYAIVNNNKQVGLKGSYLFQDEIERLAIVQSIKGISWATLSIDQDETVVESLKTLVDKISPKSKLIFYNSGDRKEGNTSSKEEEFCQKNGIELVYGVSPKIGSSSQTLQKFLDTYWMFSKNLPNIPEYHLDSDYEVTFGGTLIPSNKKY